MRIYVDAAIHGWRGKKWCHLFSEDIDALHAFAARLGLQRAWFQQPPKASWPHYDITASKREQALRLGAQPLDRRAMVLVAHDALTTWCHVNRPDLVAWATEKRNRWRACHGAGGAA